MAQPDELESLDDAEESINLSGPLRMLGARKLARDSCDLLHLGTDRTSRLCAAMIIGGGCFGIFFFTGVSVGLSIDAAWLLACSMLAIVFSSLAVLVLGPTDDELADAASERFVSRS
jgi:hypothetical protein